jgi:hypothetical protein
MTFSSKVHRFKESALFRTRAAAALTAVTAVAMLTIAMSAVTHAASCDRSINGVYTATSDGQWAKSREVFHDEANVVTVWTIASACDDVMNCAGTVTSQQGWTADLRCRSGQWYAMHRVENWQHCPDGTTTPGDQTFRFWRVAEEPERFNGYDRTIGPSGGCGVNLWLTIEMPFTLMKTN